MAAGSRGRPPRQPAYPEGIFRRASDGAQIEVDRSAGVSYPVDLRVRWLSPGEDKARAALNEMMAGIIVLEIDHLARAVAHGESYRVAALQNLAVRDGWELVSRLPDDPTKFLLVKDGETAVTEGGRADLVATLELAVRCALEPFKGSSEVPSWGKRARKVYPELEKALEGQARFEQVDK